MHKLLKIFTIYKFNSVIQILIIADVIIWSVSSALVIVLPFFVISNLKGGDISVLGLGTLIFFFSQAVSNLVSGVLMDKFKGLGDEFYAFFFAMIVRAFGILAFIFISDVTDFYILEFIVGLSTGVLGTAWRAIFTRFTDRSREATEWSADLALVNLAMGLFAYFGAILTEKINILVPFILGFALTFLGALLMLWTKNALVKAQKVLQPLDSKPKTH